MCSRVFCSGAGFEYGQENAYFRIGLALAGLKVVFPDLGLLKQLCIIREACINRGTDSRMYQVHGQLARNRTNEDACPMKVSSLLRGRMSSR